ncbi:MAG: hypothetical protein LBJ24_06120 [Treponema sp.]|jgi:hypothetical protein|nr:hypothetical protein [Treponema sp.]
MKNKVLMFLCLIGILPLFFAHADSADPVDISGIWEQDLSLKHFNKGMFSWGDNVYSTSSVIIDLGAVRPHLSCHGGGSFYISKVEYNDGKVELTGAYSDKPDETKKIIVHIINRDTISIELIDKNIAWLMNPNSKNIFYRVPRDAPYEPLGPEGI